MKTLLLVPVELLRREADPPCSFWSDSEKEAFLLDWRDTGLDQGERSSMTSVNLPETEARVEPAR